MKDKSVKTSLTLKRSTLDILEEYRRIQKIIPTRSESVEVLVCLGWKAFKQSKEPKKEKKESVVAVKSEVKQ